MSYAQAMEPIPINQIRKEDILNQPVWKFWYEEGCEKVIPFEGAEINRSFLDSFIVLTEFTINNGTKWIGFCSPQDPSGLDYIQPVITIDSGQIFFYKDMPWTEQEKEIELLKLGYSYSEIFPISFRTKVKCDNQDFASEILDFEP